MKLKLGFTSDIDLESKFRHMTSKRHIIYENDQLETFKKLTDVITDNKIDILFIVGNLFGVYKPKNKSIENVMIGFNKIINHNTRIIILPATHDMPFNFSYDQPIHLIFQNYRNNITVLYDKKLWNKDNIIKEPVFSGLIKNIPFQIFSPPNLRIPPEQYVFDFQGKKEYINIFLLANLFYYNIDPKQHLLKIFEKLKDKNIDYVIIGGINPFFIRSPDLNKNVSQTADENDTTNQREQYLNNSELKEILKNYNFQVIFAPQLHQNNFNYCHQPHGLLITSLECKPPEIGHCKINLEKLIPISKFKMIQDVIEIDGIKLSQNSEDVNEDIKMQIINRQLKPDEKILYQLKLTGTIRREEYHQLDTYLFLEIGLGQSYYFELMDEIKFSNVSKDITHLKIETELEDLTNILIDELKNKPDSEFTETTIENEIELYNKALQKIKKELKNS